MDTKKYLKITGLLSVLLVFVLIGCNSNQSKSDANDSDTAVIINKETIKAEVADVVYPLPSPFELTNMLNEIGARFEAEVLNSSENTDKYITEKDKALNLGVYGADLSYAVAYNKKQEINEYLKSTKQMVDELGITVDFTHLLDNDTKLAVVEKDSLVNLVSTTYYDTYSFLNEKSEPSLATLMTAGFWVEGMYIATHISDYTFDNYEIVKILFNQKESVKKLIELLKAYESDDYIQEMIAELVLIEKAYNGAETSLNQKQLETIKSTIAKVRTSIVE